MDLFLLEELEDWQVDYLAEMARGHHISRVDDPENSGFLRGEDYRPALRHATRVYVDRIGSPEDDLTTYAGMVFTMDDRFRLMKTAPPALAPEGYNYLYCAWRNLSKPSGSYKRFLLALLDAERCYSDLGVWSIIATRPVSNRFSHGLHRDLGFRPLGVDREGEKEWIVYEYRFAVSGS